MCCNFCRFYIRSISYCSSSAKTDKFICAWTLWVSVNQEKNQIKYCYWVLDYLIHNIHKWRPLCGERAVKGKTMFYLSLSSMLTLTQINRHVNIPCSKRDVCVCENIPRSKKGAHKHKYRTPTIVV